MAWRRAAAWPASDEGMDHALLDAYAAETARLVRQRLAMIAPLFVVLMGTGVAFEMVSRPERSGLVLAAWLAESSVVVLAAVLARIPWFERRSAIAATLVMAGVTVLVTLYNVLV